jgi:Holliday junction resolvase RusA-like endonuclease
MLKIKALSINEAYRGRRFKSDKYKSWEKELWYLLPNKNIPAGKLAFKMQVGVSNPNCDVDNFLKPFIDVLQKKYIFNDNRICKIDISKDKVKKGEEYIKFELKSIDKV